MEKQYHIKYKEKFYKDLNKIKKNINKYYYLKVSKKINSDIYNLKCMPRIHRRLICMNDKDTEYRRMLSGKYVIIYKINKNEITILRIFNQKQNYLNSKKFILKEKSNIYKITK